MAYLLGVVLFVLAIFVSVCLHEAGHMATAKAFGMRVTRYFAGFGPTIWSFRKGETEYGLKGIPLGGFVKIVGMTPQDEDANEPGAMWRYPVWKRTVVMIAGSVTHFVLGFVLLWMLFAFIGMPNPALADAAKIPAYIQVESCVVPDVNQPNCKAGDPRSPAQEAGLRSNDKILSVGGKPVSNYDDLVKAIRASAVGPVSVTYERDGTTRTTTMNLIAASRPPLNNPSGKASMVPAMGVSLALPPGVPTTVTYGPIDSVGKAGQYTGQTFGQVFQALGRLPGRIPGVWDSILGKPRDVNGPISVVGAARLGGQSVEYSSWATFFGLLISLNLFLGVFNLLPLLPLDGGHIAVAWFGGVRSWIYRRLRRDDPGPVDYYKLAPLTWAVVVLGGGLVILTVAADIINPVTLQ